MSDFNIRSESIDVEQIMEQIRERIREKRGVDYTEQQIRELAAVKLEKLLDPHGVRSDLLDRFRRVQAEHEPPPPPNYTFEEATLYETHRGLIRRIRRLLQPVLKLFFNPNPLIQALNIQSRLNTLYAQRESTRRGLDDLYFEVIHNLVVETTRLGIEVKNLKMRVESFGSRLDFNERRSRALESAVVYKPSSDSRSEPPAPSGSRTSPTVGGPPQAPASPVDPGIGSAGPVRPQVGGGPPEGPGQRSRRRRRRRGRRGGPMAPAGAGDAAAPSPAEEADEAGLDAPEPPDDSADATDDAVEDNAHQNEAAGSAPSSPAGASSSESGSGGPEPDQQ